MLGLLGKSQGHLRHRVPEDVVVHIFHSARARYAPASIVDVCWRFRPDVVLSTSAHLNCSLIVARPLLPSGTRLLLREGTILSRSVQASRSRRWIYRQLYRRGDKIICQSAAMAEDMHLNFNVPDDKIALVPNPVDFANLEVLAGDVSPYARAGPHIVAVGTLSPVKRFDVLLRVFSEVHRHLPSAKLTIVGDGVLRSVLKKSIVQLDLADVVDTVGFKANPYPHMRYADLLIQTSEYEGLPNVVLESVALGTRVIALACLGGTSDIAAVTRRVRVVSTEAELIAETVCSLTANEAVSPLEAKFIDCFSVSSVLRRYEELFRFNPRRSMGLLVASAKSSAVG